MVPGLSLERVCTARAAHAGRTSDDRRAGIVRLIGLDAGAEVSLARCPCGLERDAVALRIVAREKRRILRNPCRNEIVRNLLDHRLALSALRAQNPVAAPALEPCGELPAEIDRVLQSVVETKTAIGRMAVRRVPRNEDAACPISVRYRDAKIPEPDVIEVTGKIESRRALDQSMNVEIVGAASPRPRRMKEPGLFVIDAPEELPVAVEVRMHHPIGGTRRKSLQAPMQLA